MKKWGSYIGTTVYLAIDPLWCNMILRSKDCYNEVIILSLQGIIKRSLKDNTCDLMLIGFIVTDNICNKTAFSSASNINFRV